MLVKDCHLFIKTESFVFYVNALVLQDEWNIVLTNIGLPCQQTASTLEGLSYIMLAGYNIIKDATP